MWVSDVVQKALIGYVDDDPFVLEAAGFLLIAFGYDVVLFSSAESALSNRGESQIDCLVTDLQLPGLSGLQLYERLRLDGRHVPTIVVTAFADERVRCQAQQAGVSAVLEKPVANDALLRAIESALSSSPSPPK
ncbi:MAG TPA: response regulator [Fimbriimonadaceae bacterium]|nr:response regulator [Fimbriimonadaceae bacterium]